MNIPITTLVCLATPEQVRADRQVPPRTGRHMGGGRFGTITGSLEAFARRTGPPHEQVHRRHWRDYDRHPLLDGAGKVSAVWYVSTPRGLVTVRDYWWNGRCELSLAGTHATDNRARLWAARWLRHHGWPVSLGDGEPSLRPGTIHENPDPQPLPRG